jgi:hypothetical protein
VASGLWQLSLLEAGRQKEAALSQGWGQRRCLLPLWAMLSLTGHNVPSVSDKKKKSLLRRINFQSPPDWGSTDNLPWEEAVDGAESSRVGLGP